MHGGIPLDEPRAGARVLGLLANPLHVRIVKAHAGGRLRLAELHERTEWPAQTTLRVAVGALREHGALGHCEVSRMPYGTATELTEAGREVLFVIEVVERWLTGSPQGPIQIDSDAGKAALKALSEGWNSTMVRELADEPASLTELDRRIAAMSYPSLERRLSRMRSTRQVEPSPGDGRGQPFAVTDWLRHSVAPLCAAGRCERLHMAAASTPITGVEIEAAFLLALPLVPLPETANGLCVLSVLPEAMQNGDPVASPEAAGVTVQVESGTMVRCIPAVLENGPVWALGTPMAWLSAVIDGHFEGLRYGGAELQLAADLVNGLHLALFGE